jgi:hypothetical protein
MRKRPPTHKPTHEELVAEEAFGRALDQHLNEVGIENFLNPLRTSRADFCDKEQAAAWRQAMAQLTNKDNPSVEGFYHVLRLGKPVSGRLAGVLARLLRGGVVIPIEGPQPEDIDLPPERLVEVVVQAWPDPKTRKRPPGAPRDPVSRDKARKAAREVIFRHAEWPRTSWRDIIQEVAEEYHVAPKLVRFELESLKEYNANLRT